MNVVFSGKIKQVATSVFLTLFKLFTPISNKIFKKFSYLLIFIAFISYVNQTSVM